jgi:CRISPR-associated endonuclease/helicase Cas3
MTSATYYRFWGKTDRASDAKIPPYHLLPYHSLDVAATAKVLLERDDLLRKRLARLLELEAVAARDLLVFLIALHDTGKFAEGFQSRHRNLFKELRGRFSEAAYTVYHDTLGYVAWEGVIWGVAWSEDWFCLREFTDQYSAKDYFTPLMRAVAGHHGTPPELDHSAQRADLHFGDEAQTALLDFARSCRFLLPDDKPFPTWNYDQDRMRAKRASWLVAGLTVLADWIGSNSNYFSYRQNEIALEVYWREHALPQAEAAIGKTGVLSPPASSTIGPQALFPNLFPQHDPTPLQQHAATCALGDGPQLFMLEDLTGSGKTEAALLLAHRLMADGRGAGLYVALPTMATADAMYERVGDAYQRLYDRPESVSLVLAHSAREHVSAFQRSVEIDDPKASAVETYDGTEQTGRAHCTAWLADSRKKALLASVGVGTIDQALIGILPARHQSLRLAGLSRSVLVVDEVHACDAYMQRLLQRLLAFHAAQGGSAILLSATLPQRMRKELSDAFRRGLGADPVQLENNDFPFATRVGAAEKREQPVASKPGAGREIGVQPFHDEKAVVDHLISEVEQGRCACWIRNTVGDATRAYRSFCERLDAGRVELFHARFALCDRQAIEARVLKHFGKDSGPEERSGKVVVATQVIEQSLDLDFDVMVTDLAPMDLIIQRAGRMHRHPRTADGAHKSSGSDERKPPVLGVLMPPLTDEPGVNWYKRPFPGGAFVYPEVDVLWRTAQVLDRHGRIELPEKARVLVESVYGEDAVLVPDAIAHAAQDAKSQTRIDASLAESNALTLDAGYGNAADRAHWQSDERTPTRLGDETTTIRLGRQNNGRVEPWADDAAPHPWPRSELSVRTAKIADSDHSQIDAGAVAAAKETMPDNGQWSTLVVMRGPSKNDHGETVWAGGSQNADGDPVRVVYSETTGLHVHPIR